MLGLIQESLGINKISIMLLIYEQNEATKP